ncbi:MAG: DUF3685 domain-containing protein [Spirulinaceae cyanobacterium]
MTQTSPDIANSPFPMPLWVVSDDPIFRLGLVTALAALTRFRVEQDCDRTTALAAYAEAASQPQNILIVEVGSDFAWLERWAQIADPERTLLLTAATLVEQDTQQSLGFRYRCPRGSSLEAIAALLMQLSEGVPPAPVAPARRTPTPLTSPSFPQAPPRWLYNLRRAGLQQIQISRQQLEQTLALSGLTRLDRWFLEGRQRELRLAQWLVNQLLPVQVILAPAVTPGVETPREAAIESATAIAPSSAPRETPAEASLSQRILNACLGRARRGLDNATPGLMAIDILQPAKRLELVYVIVAQLADWLEQAQFLATETTTLQAQTTEILQDLWQRSTLEWLRRYYPVGQTPQDALQAVLTSRDLRFITPPLVDELLQYLVDETPLTIDHVAYRPESPEAQTRAGLFLDHLVIDLANQVMAFLLNQYGEVELVKLELYRRDFLATREITQFRNELSWCDRQATLLLEPIAIFESRYRLWQLEAGEIQIHNLYAPRLEELHNLQGIPWLVTMTLELRDALAPRVRAAIAILGQGVVYLLTQVLGRGLGLIGRGILQGLGSSWPKTHYDRNSNE